MAIKVTVCYDDHPDEVAEKFVKALRLMGIDVQEQTADDDDGEVTYEIGD